MKQSQRELHVFSLEALLKLAALHPSQFKLIVSILDDQRKERFERCVKAYVALNSAAQAAERSAQSIQLKAF